MKTRQKILVTLSMFILVIFTSIGYAALNTDLSISGDAYVRVEDDIRVTNIKMISSENNAYETYNNKYTKDTTSTYVTMPNTNSKLTYEIEITNNSNSRYYLSNIEENIYSNKNIKYEIEDISVGDIIPSSTVKKIKIAFTTNTPNQNTDLVLKYVFKKVDKTEWVYAYTGGEQILTVPYNGRYKLETWGAQGGSHVAIGGYGGYSIGNTYLKNNNVLYINAGEAGNSSSTKNLPSTYNGGGSSLYQIGMENNRFWSSGGGATHIATKSGILSSLENYKSNILIVSGGGGGSFHDIYSKQIINGGSAGGYIGSNGDQITTGWGSYGYGGTQTNSGYSICDDTTCSSMSASRRDGIVGKGGFGYGGNGVSSASGGGGGFYGGGGSVHVQSAGGGSSYIGNPLLTNKTMYCYNCQESSEESTKTISTTCTSEKPTSNCAKQGNGYAKITFID